MDKPRVSIIIPIYKTEKYLYNCLLSVQRQTMPDFEAILVNDCTPDNSMKIAKDFVETDSRFTIIEHEENKGLGWARNSGMEIAQGEYINFLDSDDLLPIDSLQIMLRLAEENQADMIIGNMAWSQNHQLDPVKYIDQRIKSWLLFWRMNIRKLSEEYSFIGSVCNRLIKNSLFRQYDIKFPQNVMFEDIPFTLTVWFYSNYIFFTPHFVYFRTKRSDAENLSLTQIYNEKSFFDRDIVAECVYHFSSQVPNAAKLGIVTLCNMFCTEQNMINSVDKSIENKIKNIWYPEHAQKIETMILGLNKLSIK